uniref:Uncharacterized protein n=1 Tax=Setaria viridis TaxID=4556 RepID=A0A4U6UC39_SETVI|nr:hypothetical protein SEVIR_5G107800v2 [Setaria viridis]
MAAAQWTVLVRERAIEAKHLCNHARTLLRGAAEHLALPMHVADAQGGRARAELVGVELFNANHGLSSAVGMMAAADLLAPRGAAADPNPTVPLPSDVDIPDAHESELSALGMLREARVYAEAAHGAVEWCFDRLLTAYDLLDQPGLPGVDGFVADERDAARDGLVDAEHLAAVSAAYAYTALCLLFPELV